MKDRTNAWRRLLDSCKDRIEFDQKKKCIKCWKGQLKEEILQSVEFDQIPSNSTRTTETPHFSSFQLFSSKIKTRKVYKYDARWLNHSTSFTSIEALSKHSQIKAFHKPSNLSSSKLSYCKQAFISFIEVSF